MLDLPPVRMGLLTKLNLLTIGLIFMTAVAITAFYANQRWRDDEQELRARGAALASVMTELAEYALYTYDKASLEQILDGIGVDPDVAFVAVLDRKLQPLAERRFMPSLMEAPLPSVTPAIALAAAGKLQSGEYEYDGHKFLQIIARVECN